MVLTSPVIELRQYTLRPGQRDVLIELFETYLVESQEDTGMTVVGTFRDLDDQTKFVWLRSFDDMTSRTNSLHAFYSGPVWQAHREVANGTMVDSYDVLLLRPMTPQLGFTLSGVRRGFDVVEPVDRGFVEAMILRFDQPVGAEALERFETDIAPRLENAGGTILSLLTTEYSENTFPALPIRENEHILAWFAGFPTRVAYNEAELARVAVAKEATSFSGLGAIPKLLRLDPTRRSMLTGQSAATSLAR